MGNLESNQSDNNSNPGLLGEYLKQKRLDKNFSLEKLSQKTKISVNILKSLESNDLKSLPSAAYIKGFVTSYAKVLGLPLDEAIRKMEYTYENLQGKPFPALNHTKLMSKSSPSAQVSPVTESATPKPAEALSPQDVISSGDSIMENTKSILPVAIFACVILLFIGGYKLISSVVEGEVTSQKTKNLGPKIETSSALVKPVPKKDPPAAAVTPATPPTETKPADATTPVAATPTPAPEETKPAPEIQRNFPTINFTKIKGKLFNTKSDAPENTDLTVLPERIKSSMDPQQQNVYITAPAGDTWMSYKIDNKPIESVILNKGGDLYLQGGEIRIFLGNVAVTKIFYNNYLIETPTKSGVKSLVFPESSNSKYVLPLFPKAKDDIFYTAEEYMKRMKLEEDELGKKPE